MVRKPLSQEEIAQRERLLEEKYGGPEGLRQKRREWQAKSRLKYKGTGGFAANPGFAKEMSQKGHAVRWGHADSN